MKLAKTLITASAIAAAAIVPVVMITAPDPVDTVTTAVDTVTTPVDTVPPAEGQPMAPPLQPEYLLPDSFVVMRDTIDIQIGDTIQIPLIAWWTIPQELAQGSRPFICFGGAYGIEAYAIEGWHEIVFPGGYPATTSWELVDRGHSFTGETPCLTGEVTTEPLPSG